MSETGTEGGPEGRDANRRPTAAGGWSIRTKSCRAFTLRTCVAAMVPFPVANALPGPADGGPLVPVTHPRDALPATGPAFVVLAAGELRARTWSAGPLDTPTPVWSTTRRPGSILSTRAAGGARSPAAGG